MTTLSFTVTNSLAGTSRDSDPPSLIQEIRGYLKIFGDLRGSAVQILCAAVISGIMEAWGIALFPQILSDPSQTLPLFSFLGISSLALVFGYLSDEWSWIFKTNLEATIRLSLVDYFANLPWSAASQVHSGRIHRTFTTEAYEIANGAYSLIRAGAAVVTMIGLFIVVALHSLVWFGSLLLIAATLLSLFVLFHRRSWAPLARGTVLLSEAIDKTGDTWQCLKYSRSTEEFDFIRQALSDDVKRTSQVKRQYRILYPRIAFATRMVCLLAICGFVASAMHAGLLHGYGWLVPFAIFYRLVPHVVHMHSLLHDAHTSFPWVLAYKSIQEIGVRKSSDQQPSGEALRVPDFKFQIQLQQVSFHYDARTPVLNGLTLSIAKGDKVAITGPSGSGKSTLIDLITGLLSPTHGTLTLDGADFTKLDLAAWRKKVSLVAQDTLLFQGTIEQNILWGQAFNQELLQKCLQRAALDSWVNSLPQNLATPIGELGKTISRGQQQRIAIARALYRQPELIILDEPTNGLDSNSCKMLLELIADLPTDLTLLVITHDLRLLPYCKTAYDLDEGILSPLSATG